jgi:hypothetical protein
LAKTKKGEKMTGKPRLSHGMIEYKTPCNKYTYLSYGLPGSREKGKSMMDFCKNHCKIEVCKLLKKEVKK